MSVRSAEPAADGPASRAGGPSWTARLGAWGGHRRGAIECGGAVLVLLVAVALFTRFGLDDTLRRDEAIYTYAGQQFAHGVAPYASIFDPKTPLASMLAGAGVAAARIANVDEVHAVRLVFMASACLAVVAVFWLALRLWNSVVAAVVAGLVFASFRGFALDALGGPDAKTPGVLFAVLAMLLLLRRRWFWGALAGSLAFLVWQPFGVYPALAVLAAPLAAAAGERRRAIGAALVGAAVPLAATVAYFWRAHALGVLVEAAIRFPLTGVRRTPETLARHAQRIAAVVDISYGREWLYFWGGLIAFVVALAARAARAPGRPRARLADPAFTVVLASFVALAIYSLRDFQGYPDLYPGLPYAALGAGGAAALLVAAMRRDLARRLAIVVSLAAAAATAGLAWHAFSVPRARDTALLSQRARVAEIDQLARARGSLLALGDPTPLVLAHRRNATRFIYLGSGVGPWVVAHTPGGFRGWTARLYATHPGVVTIGGWQSRLGLEMQRWWRARYREQRIGAWHVFVRPSAADRRAGARAPQ